MTGSVIPYQFTPFPKAYEELFYRLSNPAKDLLMFLSQKILAWHTDRKAFSNAFVCQVTNLSETGLRRARKVLKKLGVLQCGTQKVAGRTRVLYRMLIPGLPLLPKTGFETEVGVDAEAGFETEVGVDAEAGFETEVGVDVEAGFETEVGVDVEAGFETAPKASPRQRWRGTPATAGAHVKNMKTTSKKEHHQERARTKTPRTESNPSEEPVLTPPPTPDDETPRSLKTRAELTESQARLAARLQQLGVHRSMSRRLIQSKPLELILKVLNQLPFRQARNPAAYLVRELLDGGYGEVPAALSAPAERAQEDLHARRKREEKLEQDRREREERELKEHVEGVLVSLAPEERRLLFEEARGRLGPWAARFALDDGNPVLRGSLCDLVLERWPLGGGESRAGEAVALVGASRAG